MMSKSLHNIFLLATAVLLCACSQDEEQWDKPSDSQAVTFRVSFAPFVGESVAARTTVDGLAWEANDRFRLRIACPYTTDHQNGELWSSGFYLYTFPSSADPTIIFSSGSEYQSQATTYIYTAQNTTGTRYFVVNNYRYTRPSNFFYADQSKLAQFKASDVVWAQAIRQTGAQEVHLNFHHKVAKLVITLDDTALSHKEWSEEDGDSVNVADPLSENAVLTLEGMPDIDGAELVVGDYYAPMCYENEKFNYREKAACGYELNGKVLGVEVIDEAATATQGSGKGRSSIATLTGGPSDLGETRYARIHSTVPNTGVYTCYRLAARQYLLYVPPCELPTKATFWVRDGERRYSATLDVQKFTEGYSYPIRLVLKP